MALCGMTVARADPCAPRWAEGFDTNGVDGLVLALTVADLGAGPRLFAGGSFLSAGTMLVHRLASWDGRRWSELGGGVDSTVFALAAGPRASEKAVDDLYVGGGFQTAGGAIIGTLARWDGSAWHDVGGGVGGVASPFVTALACSDALGGDALFAGGSFLTAGGASASNIARWDGGSWSPLGSGLSDRAHALAIYDDGRGPALFVGGRFLSAGGAPAARIARWDGASWEPLGGGVSGTVSAMSVFDDGRGSALYVGGSFSSAGGATAFNLARWNGVGWESVGGGMDGPVLALATFDDRTGNGDALYVGGRFDVAGGVIASRIARWDGTAWSALESGLAPLIPGKGVPSGSARAMLEHDDGAGPGVFIGGDFALSGSEVAGNMARWYVARGCCPGDANVDRLVNMLDLSIVLGEFGGTGTGCFGDITRDGRVDFFDLAGVLGLYGGSCPPAP